MTDGAPRSLPGSKTFHARKDAWIETLTSPNTRLAYRRDLEVFAAWMSAARRSPLSATAEDLDAFRESCENDGIGPATLNRRLSALTSFFREAGQRGGVRNPASRTLRAVAAEVDARQNWALTPAQTDAIWAAARALGDKTEALIALILFDRFKASELLPVDLEDVVVRTDRATIGVSRRDKFEKVTLDARTADAIRRYRASRRSGPLLMGDNPTRATARLTRSGVDYLVKKVGQSAQLSFPLTVNLLRSAPAAD